MVRVAYWVVGVAMILVVVGCDGAPREGLGLSPVDAPVPIEEAPGQVGNRLCHALRTCECDRLVGVSLAGCESGFRFTFDAVLEDAAVDGLSYDPACMMRRLNAMNERGCEPQTRFGPGCVPEACQVFHGELPLGSECEGSASASNCAQGLVCFGICVEPDCSGPGAGPVGEGGVCAEEGTPIALCEEGLGCDVDTGRCVPLPVDGEPCIASQCAAGNYCDFAGADRLCRAQQSVGEECLVHQVCETLRCDEGVCGPLPVEGERCGGRCADGFACTFEGGMATCLREPEAGEPCLSNPSAPCRAGLACDGGVCREPPGDAEACLMGGLLRCREDLVCGGAFCRTMPSAPGCERCDDPDGNCVVQVCMPPPPAVCGDLGGLLF